MARRACGGKRDETAGEAQEVLRQIYPLLPFAEVKRPATKR